MLFHNPVVLAKRFATLDVLSDGRAIGGLGIGWSKDEYEVSGIPHKYRAHNIWICFFPTRPGYEEDGGDNKTAC